MATIAQLYDSQRELITSIGNLIRNYKADSKERKREPNYHNKKINQLDQVWNEFDRNDGLIRADPGCDQNDGYFTEENYAKMKEVYEKQREKILAEQKVLFDKIEEKRLLKEKKEEEKRANELNSATTAAAAKGNSSFADFNELNELQKDDGIETFDLAEISDNDDDDIVVNNDENLPETVKVYLFLYNEVKSVINFAEKMDMHETQGIASAQLDNIRMVWNDFRMNHRTISVSEHGNYCVKMNELQARYLSVVGKLNDMVKGDSSKQSVELPKIKLPEFDGEQSNWKTFKDLFDKIIHNNTTISDAFKIQYLKSNLTGKAAKMVQHLPSTSASYKKCYELLHNRYENERESVSSLIDQILNIEVQKQGTSYGLKLIHDTTYDCIMSIESVGTSVKNWDVLLIQILMRKLDKKTIIDYESKLESVKKNQTLEFFLNFLERRFLALMSAESKTKGNSTNEKNYEKSSEKSNEKLSEKSNEAPFLCTFCEKPHSIYKCHGFKKLSPAERLDSIKVKKLCFVCLQKHGKNECKSKYDCKICEKKHNVLLHIEKQVETKTLLATAAEKTDKNETSANEINIKTLIVTRDEDNLLATAMVNVYTKNGNKVLLRAVVDMGSQSPMITERAQQALGLETETVSAGVDGVDALQTKTNKRTQLNIFSRFSDNYALHIKPLVMKNITNLNVFKDDLSKYEHLHNLNYADPSISSNQPIDILLGVADYTRIVTAGLIKNKPEEPIAQNTELGWLILGPNGAKNGDDTENESVTILISNTEIDERIRHLFEMPEIADGDLDSGNDQWTEEEKFCEEYFVRTTRRDADGRFIVSMPFKNNCKPVLGNSKKAALAMLYQLERRFEKNHEFKKLYGDYVKNAIEKGYLVKLEKPFNDAYYIPHHAVFKDSSTTKLRPVYNASQRTTNGKSLNEQLAMGKMDQPTIFELLLRWRTYEIAFIEDIEKMYLQIKLDEAQHYLQVILWWEEETNKICEYKMTTVTFGLANSPYLAIRWLKEVAKTVAAEYPLAAHAIGKSFFMDDHTGGASTVNKAINLHTQLKTAFETVGCNLRKVMSNSNEFMSTIPESDRAQMTTDTIKVLGILWKPTCDTLPIKIGFNLNTKAETKRQIVSEMATVYDPLGLITPMMTKAKNLVQRIWQMSNQEKKYGWDDKLSEEIIEEWLKIKKRAIALNTMEMPRWVHTSSENNLQIHGFCDASQKAFAACVYIRSCKGDSITTTLLASKAKNAQTNQTIPKLELCGAQLLVQLVNKVSKAIEVKIDEIHLWSDSTCVLGWVAANPLRYKKYVSTRILFIQKLKNVKWHHIAGKENPADCASRGVFGDELKENKLWRNGPKILRECIDFNREEHMDYATENELKTIKISALISVKNESFIPQSESFYKLKKKFAFVLRFVHNCKGKSKRTGRITVNEMQQATTTLTKIVQREEFADEIKCLRNKTNINKKSKLAKLCVFLDDNDLLRVGGRLKNACLPFEAKHQVLLPKKHTVTNLLIGETHKLALHGGPKVVASIIRQKYWIIDAQSAIKSRIGRCFHCAKFAPKAMEQLMANLPEYRVNKPLKVFMCTAIDYAGPFYTKTSTLRNSKTEKSYVAVFVCMATKAIHLELASNLTAECFIAALRRFISRRGKVYHIFSDNGTNFVASNKILHDLNENEKSLYQRDVDEEFLSKEIVWHFAPPGSPHHNGLAEAAVKSMKFHLKRANGEKHLTIEEMNTLLCQVEAVVNSRPICALSNDPNDLSPLTPAHFLNMSEMELAPDDDVSDVKSNYLSRWHLVQKIFQNFWTHWKLDYVNQLQIRNKWNTQNPEVNIDDLVMVKDESLPATKWALGRVLEKHPGKDGMTRVVTVKTGRNVIKRTITKIAPMPMVEDDEKTNKNEKPCGVNDGLKMGTIATLLCLLSMASTAKAHEFSFLETDQKLVNKQNISIAVKNSNTFAFLIVLGLFGTFFFLFLMYLIRIMYRGAPSTTNISEETNRAAWVGQATVESPMQPVTNTIGNGTIPHAEWTLNSTIGQQPNGMNRMPTPVPAMRNEIIHEEMHQHARKTSISIYPSFKLSDELSNLSKSLEE